MENGMNEHDNPTTPRQPSLEEVLARQDPAIARQDLAIARLESIYANQVAQIARLDRLLARMEHRASIERGEDGFDAY